MTTIVFDLDGTLIDSLPDVCLSLNHALEHHGYPHLTLNSVKGLVGGGARPLVTNALIEVGGDPEYTDAIQKLFKERYSAHPITRTTLYPGVLETLASLKSAGHRLGICTNKPEETTWPVLQALDLEQFFPVVVCGDTKPYKKPDPRHVFDVVNGLDGDINRTLFVGDSEPDVIASQKAGIPVVVVSYGYSKRPVETLGATEVIHQFSDLLITLAK